MFKLYLPDPTGRSRLQTRGVVAPGSPQSEGLLGRATIENSLICDFRCFEIFQRISSRNDVVCFLYLSEYLGVPKIKYNWFWESWSRPLGPKSMEMKGGFGFP